MTTPTDLVKRSVAVRPELRIASIDKPYKNVVSIDANRAVIRQLFTNALLFASHDTDRPVLNGFRLWWRNDGVTIDSTDSYVLLRQESPDFQNPSLKIESLEVVVGRRTAERILVQVGKDRWALSEMTTLVFEWSDRSEGQVTCVTKDMLSVHPLQQGEFPNVDSFISPLQERSPNGEPLAFQPHLLDRACKLLVGAAPGVPARSNGAIWPLVLTPMAGHGGTVGPQLWRVGGSGGARITGVIMPVKIA